MCGESQQLLIVGVSFSSSERKEGEDEALKSLVSGRFTGSIKQLGLYFMVFWFLNTFQKDQPGTFQIAARGALRRG